MPVTAHPSVSRCVIVEQGVQVIRLLRPTFRRCHKTHSERGNDMKRSFWLACITLLHGMGVAATAGADEQNTPSYDLDIDALPLMAAVKSLSDETGIEILYFSEIAEGVTSSPVKGEFTPQEALETMLVRTDLEVVQLDQIGAVAIRPVDDQGGDSDQKNVSPAPIMMAQNTSSKASTTRRDAEDAAEEEASLVPLEEIVVIGTGTNIRGVENPTIPMLTFDKDDIDLSGAGTLDEFLSTIPQNFGSTTPLATNSGAGEVVGLGNRDQTQGTVLDLRGLGPGSTLVLLNGRRMTAAGEASTVDIGVLPLGLIERVDVLTDGATAVYGSDAVGGVVNFTTRRDFDGFDINARYGTVTDGSKENLGFGVAGGFSWGSGSYYAGANYEEQTPLLFNERDFVDLTRVREEGSFGSDTERYSIGAGTNQELTANTLLRVDALYSDNASKSADATAGETILNTSNQTALYVNTQFERSLSDDVIAEVFLDYGENEVDNTAVGDGITGGLSNSLFENEQLTYEARVSGELIAFPGGQLSFSTGALRREESYTSTFAAALADQNVSADRDVFAAYTEVLLPLIGEGNASPLGKEIILSLAARYEDYSDFGDTVDPKLGVFWAINEQLSLRASYSESFRAPDLQSLNFREAFFATPFSTAFVTAIPAEELPEPVFPFGPTVPSYQLLVPSGGNPGLGPETATTWSVGFVYEPTFLDGLRIETNFYDIAYSDRLETVFITDVLQDPAFREFVTISPDVQTVQDIFDRAERGEVQLINPFLVSPEDIQLLFDNPFQNVSQRNVRGVDLSLTYFKDTNFGQFNAVLNGSFTSTYESRPTETSPTSDQLDVLYRPIGFKLRGNISWTRDGFTVFSAINYVDSYRDNPDAFLAGNIDAWTTVDLSLFYQPSGTEEALLRGARVGISVTNVLDEDPPFAVTPFGLNYDGVNANPFGRQISFNLSRAF